jgi:hypothetical protein
MNDEMQNPIIEIRNTKLDLDELLRSYFRSEMPQPWPGIAELKIEDRRLDFERNVAQTREDANVLGGLAPLRQAGHFNRCSFSRSRLVLAASVALLLIGSWWLGQKFSASQSAASPSSSGKMIGFKHHPAKSNSLRPSPPSAVR